MSVYLSLYKGKKNALRTNKKKEDSKEKIVTSQTETKENKPASNKVCMSELIQSHDVNSSTNINTAVRGLAK